MKCSSCYAENPAWATVCATCGGSALPLEFCPGGHLLPPGVRECPVCPSLWPEVAPFSGPPILRGLFRVERGRLSASDRKGSLEYFEARDRESPLALAELPSGGARLVADDDPAATLKILTRPAGLTICRKAGAPAGARGRPSAGGSGPTGSKGPPAYEPLPPDLRLELGEVSLRFLPLEVPSWVEARVAR